jgi:hypothetical protein
MKYGRDGRCGEGYLEEDVLSVDFLRGIVDEKNGERCRRIDVKAPKERPSHFVLSQSLRNPPSLFKPPSNHQMAAATPRASGLWEYSTEMTYSRLSARDDSEGIEPDSRTPLDRTIDQIGMGSFLSLPLDRLYGS